MVDEPLSTRTLLIIQLVMSRKMTNDVMMRNDECRVLIVHKGDNLFGSHVGKRWGRASLWVDCNLCVLSCSGVGEAAHL